MAHNIKSMMYVGAKPWHGLGTKIDSELNTDSALKSAGLDWEVESVPTPHPYTLKPTKFRSIVRKDNGQVFTTNLSKDYKPFQNRSVLEFGDKILDDAGAKWHTAGCLGDGSRMWALAKFPGHIRIKGTDDLSEKFLLLSNDHSGKKAQRTMATVIRVVCQNTLNAAEGSDVFFSVNHSEKMENHHERIQKSLGILNDKWKKTEEMYNLLASKVANQASVEAIINSLIPLKSDDDSSGISHRENMIACFEDNDGNAFPTINGTMWALYNGITRYIDHLKAPHGNIENMNWERKANSLLFGTDFNMKEQGLELILEAIK